MSHCEALPLLGDLRGFLDGASLSIQTVPTLLFKNVRVYGACNGFLMSVSL